MSFRSVVEADVELFLLGFAGAGEGQACDQQDHGWDVPIVDEEIPDRDDEHFWSRNLDAQPLDLLFMASNPCGEDEHAKHGDGPEGESENACHGQDSVRRTDKWATYSSNSFGWGWEIMSAVRAVDSKRWRV